MNVVMCEWNKEPKALCFDLVVQLDFPLTPSRPLNWPTAPSGRIYLAV